MCAWPRGLLRFTLILPDTDTADLTYKVIDKLEEQERARLKAAAQEETKLRRQMEKQMEDRRMNLQIQNGNIAMIAGNEV